jgi:methylmalonyl-CoA mutase, N-terminal domain
MEVLTVDGQVEQDQIAALRATRGRREAGQVRRCLDELGRVAATTQNLMVPLVEAAHARASVGEIMNALADVFGRYEPKSA